MKKLAKDITSTYGLLSNKELLNFMDHHSREYNRLKKIAIKRNIFKKKLNRKDDVEVMNIITQSDNINQCLKTVYAHQKRVGSSGYQRISRLMVSHNLRFKDGSIYIHRAHEDLFAEGKESLFIKPLTIASKIAIRDFADKEKINLFKGYDNWWRLIGISPVKKEYLNQNKKRLEIEIKDKLSTKIKNKE